MTRFAALVLALVPGAAVWALLLTLRFEVLLALGVVALLGGIWTLAQPLPKGLRAAVAAFACLSLLGTTGARMAALAGSFRPFSTYTGLDQRDLVELFLPVASEGEYALDGADRDAPRVILNLDRRDQLVWRQKRVSLAEADGVLGSLPDAKVLIRSDRDVPFQHVGWLAALAAASGHRDVRLAVERFGRLPGDDTLLGAELSGEHWPQLELPFPIGPAEGLRMRVVATRWQEALWPPASWGPDDVPRAMERVATGVRYELGGRATEDLRELALWIRETRPVAIEVDPPAPLKFVVAVQNEIRKAGHPPAALVLPPPPGDDVLRKEHLPYPAAD